VEKELATDNFEGDNLDLKWCTIRTPKEEFYSLDKGLLKLNLRKEVMDSLVNSSVLLQRIESHKFEAKTKMSFKTSKPNEQAGLTIYRTNENHFKLLKDKNSLVLIKTFKGEQTEITRIPYKDDEVYLHALGNNLEVQFSYGNSENSLIPIGDKQSLIVIADGQGNTQFNGPGVGMYATSNGMDTKNSALFDWFYYEGK
jgi:alpha-N-arabinofuranosidase